MSYEKYLDMNKWDMNAQVTPTAEWREIIDRSSIKCFINLENNLYSHIPVFNE